MRERRRSYWNQKKGLRLCCWGCGCWWNWRCCDCDCDWGITPGKRVTVPDVIPRVLRCTDCGKEVKAESDRPVPIRVSGGAPTPLAAAEAELNWFNDGFGDWLALKGFVDWPVRGRLLVAKGLVEAKAKSKQTISPSFPSYWHEKQLNTETGANQKTCTRSMDHNREGRDGGWGLTQAENRRTF